MAQLDDVVDSLVTSMMAGPNKTWGHTKIDIEHWLRMVIDEAEKIVTNHDNKNG